MVQTLVEYAKQQSDLKKRAIIELFPDASDVMGAIPFKNAPGGRYGYIREGALPTNMGFRGINETPSEGHGVVNDLTEMCFPLAGNIDVDRVLIDRFGMERRATDERMAIKAKAKKWSDTFITGDNASQPREWTGLKQRLRAVGSGASSVDGSSSDSRLVANSTGSGGGALSLAMLDRAIGQVEDPTHIVMSKLIADRFGAAQRNTSVSGFITFDQEDFGKRVLRYNGLPVLTGYGISPFGNFLPFNEVAYGGGSAVTGSIYICSFKDGGVCGIETSPMDVRDIGLTEGGVYYRTNVEHDNGICIENPYSAIRLSSITDAAIVA